jgi:hypothetical protein
LRGAANWVVTGSDAACTARRLEREVANDESTFNGAVAEALSRTHGARPTLQHRRKGVIYVGYYLTLLPGPWSSARACDSTARGAG